MPLKLVGFPDRAQRPVFATPDQSGKPAQGPIPPCEAVKLTALFRLLDALPEPKVLDMGSGTGYYAICAAKYLGPTRQVWACEADPDTLAQLAENCRLNQVELEICSALLQATGPHAPDSLCRAAGFSPNLALLDLQGGEGAVFQGMHQLLQGPLQFVLWELNPNSALQRHRPELTRLKLLAELDRLGFQHYYLAGNRFSWSDAMRHFFETGALTAVLLEDQLRRFLLYDRHNPVLLISSKLPLEEILGPSLI
ncbi:MAG: 50S ribosomal protein L11 methyltransferase [Candidatus Sericytochromatia bacterium]